MFTLSEMQQHCRVLVVMILLHVLKDPSDEGVEKVTIGRQGRTCGEPMADFQVRDDGVCRQ